MGKSVRVHVSLPCPCCGNREICVKTTSEFIRKTMSVATVDTLKYSATVFCKKCGAYSVSDPALCYHSKKEAIHSACAMWDGVRDESRFGVYIPKNGLPISKTMSTETLSNIKSQGDSDLLACPFCGSKNVGLQSITYVSKTGVWECNIGCKDCGGCVIASDSSDDPTQAVEVVKHIWNRRAKNI